MSPDSARYVAGVIWSVKWIVDGREIGYDHYQDSIVAQMDEIQCRLNEYKHVNALEKLQEIIDMPECTTLVRDLQRRNVGLNSEDSENSEEWLNFHTAIFPCHSETVESILKMDTNPIQGADRSTTKNKRKSSEDKLIPIKTVREGSYGVVVRAKDTITDREVVVKYNKSHPKYLCDRIMYEVSEDLSYEMFGKICRLSQAIHEIFVNSTLISPYILRSRSPFFNLMLGSWLCNSPSDPVRSGRFCLDNSSDSNKFYSAFAPLSDKDALVDVIGMDDVDEMTKFKDFQGVLLQIFSSLAGVQQTDLKYNHHDLHDGNILIEISDTDHTFRIPYKDASVSVDSPFRAIIIDQGCASVYQPSTDRFAWSTDSATFLGGMQIAGFPCQPYMPGDDIILVLGTMLRKLLEFDEGEKYSRVLHTLARFVNELFACTDEKYLTSILLSLGTKPRLSSVIEGAVRSLFPTAWINSLFSSVDYYNVVEALVERFPEIFEETANLGPFNPNDYKATVTEKYVLPRLTEMSGCQLS